MGAKQLTEAGNFKGRSKHLELRWRFLHHYINQGIRSIKALKRDLQLADLGTAPRGYLQMRSMGAVTVGYTVKSNVIEQMFRLFVWTIWTNSFDFDSIFRIISGILWKLSWLQRSGTTSGPVRVVP